MYVVLAEELEDVARVGANTVTTLEQVFARIAYRCGLSYRFVPDENGWILEMSDVERPDCRPEPIHSTYKKPRDAQHDLITRAVDGRVRGHNPSERALGYTEPRQRHCLSSRVRRRSAGAVQTASDDGRVRK
jgi:hypothetical protein